MAAIKKITVQTMSKEKKNRVVPKLRFPEFSKEGSWKEESISNLLDYERPDAYIVSDTNYQKVGTPVLTANKSFILGYTNEEYGIYENIPAIIFDDFTVDKKFVDFPFKVKSSAIKILKEKDDNNIRFIFELLSQIRFEAKEHKRYYISAFQNLLVNIPKPDEQQKIASCLSSLDDLITAHTQKLDALKAHKKGLMQQLFPAEGSTIPKLRFAEFTDSGEWEEKTLASICSNIASGKDKADDSGEFNLYGSTGIIGKTDSGSYEGNFILIARVGANAGFLNRANGKFGVTDNTLVIFLHESEDIDFVYYILEKTGLNKLVFGSGQPLITGGQLKNLLNYFPKPKEQQKIATCLSSLDELITAQAEKIAQLKMHKKGLMQGLFPQLG